ncbi:hypothetical protein, partial [Alistipes putredinis]|uniref:hypothetical protein n=1 Tax=Alistipes putredinis TaxID=28117 RepID=UPI003967031E
IDLFSGRFRRAFPYLFFVVMAPCSRFRFTPGSYLFFGCMALLAAETDSVAWYSQDCRYFGS